MTTPDASEARLLASTSVTSLQAEQKIAGSLIELGWDVTHGAFFRDLVTGKIRETDVQARHVSSRRVRNRDQLITLHLNVEVKSIRGYHIVFAPTTGWVDRQQGNYEWIGWHKESLFAAMPAEDLTAADLAQVNRTFRSEFSFPLSERVAKRLLPPSPQQFHMGAFRETNVGSEKELDASVLWKAVASVESAIAAGKRGEMDSDLLALRRVILETRRLRRSVGKQVAAFLSAAAGRTLIYHPIVVVDARLWSSQGGQLVEIDSCRFHKSGNYPESWVDVVTSSRADEFLKDVTLHYESLLKQQRFR